MKLHLTQTEGNNLITACDETCIAINHRPYTNSLIVLTNSLITNWQAANGEAVSFDTLTEKDFDKMAALKPEVVLLGTGKTHRFLHPKISAALTDQGISIECMTTAAACRTYNILMSEGRNVAAALIL